MPQSRSVLSLAAAAAVTCLVSALLVPAQARASGWPSTPSGIRVAAVTGSSFTVTTNRATNTRYYRVYASTVHSDVFYDNLKAGRHPSTLHWATTTVPRVTVGGLPYTTKPYYFRVENFTGSAQSYSGIYERGLRPSRPTGLTVHNSSVGGTYLTWSAGGATGFTVQRSLNSSFTSGVGTFRIRGSNHQFTPYSLAAGRQYWFRISALNVNTYSSWSTPTAGRKAKSEQKVKVMTYNILQAISDGEHRVGGTVASWSQRRPAAAALVKSTNPDVFAVEEGWPYIGDPARHIRQVDSLQTALSAIGAHYAVAHTEILWPNKGWHRYGNYIVYNYDRYSAIGGRAGLFELPGPHYAPYVELQNRSTGARLLFVGAHLTASVGRTYDSQRGSETSSLISQASSKANSWGIPVVYSGDFNSDPEQNAYDGPNAAMRSNQIADARLVAQARYYERYDSMNELMRKPNPYSLFIDYVYVPPGVSATSWGMSMRYSNGRMVGVFPSDHNPVWAWVRIPY